MPHSTASLAASHLFAFLAAAFLAAMVSPVFAQPEPKPIPGLTEKLGFDKPAGELLAGEYENQAAGISLRPPIGCTLVQKGVTDKGNLIAEFSDEKRQWLFSITKPTVAKSTPLHTTRIKDPRDPTKEIETPGLLDSVVSEARSTNPTLEVMRQEIINVGEYGVGIAVLRIKVGSEKFLRQQAIFQASEKNYFVVNLTSPASKTGKAEDDPNETLAAQTFKQMVETIQILDQSWIRKDQVSRLYRTRALFVDLDHQGGKLIKDAILPEQYLRIQKDGKDMGYSYVVEEFLEGRNVVDNPTRAHDGVLVSIRSRLFDGDRQIDIGSQLFSSLDRKHEDWATIVNIVRNKGKANEEKKQDAEYGFTEHKLIRRINPNAPKDPLHPKNAAIDEIESYKLNIIRHWNTKPDVLTPSPWYIPQAIGTMLPRLVPLNRPVTYLFQSWASDQGEVMHRYVDVGFEKETTLNGQTVRAIAVSDRIRLEGTPTIHYMTPDGKYLGSVNQTGDSQILILPTTADELKKIWPDTDLTRPKDIARPAGAAAGTPTPVPSRQ